MRDADESAGLRLAASSLLVEPPSGSEHHRDGTARTWLAAVYVRLVAATVGCDVEPDEASVDLAARLGAARVDLSGHAGAFDPDGPVGAVTAPLWLWGQHSGEAGRPAMWAACGVRLFAALRAHGWDELAVRLDNALRPDGQPRPSEEVARAAAAAPPGALHVALGEVAARALAAAVVPYVYVVHPAYHLRFRSARAGKHAEGAAGLAARLARAGVPPGPWASTPLPTRPAPADWRPPGWIAAWPRIDSNSRGGPAARRRRGRRAAVVPPGRERAARVASVARDKRARALELYLTSAAPTIAAAARAVGANEANLRDLAADEGWYAQKRAAVRERVREVNQSIADLVTSAAHEGWLSVLLTARALRKAMADPEWAPTVHDLRVLVEAARGIAAAGGLAAVDLAADERADWMDLQIQDPPQLDQLGQLRQDEES